MRHIRCYDMGNFIIEIGMIELSVNQIMHPALFYPVTVIGILFCLCLAEGIKKVRPSATPEVLPDS